MLDKKHYVHQTFRVVGYDEQGQCFYKFVEAKTPSDAMLAIEKKLPENTVWESLAIRTFAQDNKMTLPGKTDFEGLIPNPKDLIINPKDVDQFFNVVRLSKDNNELVVISCLYMERYKTTPLFNNKSISLYTLTDEEDGDSEHLLLLARAVTECIVVEEALPENIVEKMNDLNFYKSLIKKYFKRRNSDGTYQKSSGIGDFMSEKEFVENIEKGKSSMVYHHKNGKKEFQILMLYSTIPYSNTLF